MASPRTTTASPGDLDLASLDVQRFLYHEARLLDEQRFQEWLGLFTEDALYWVPCGRDDIDPRREVSFIYDDLSRMHERVGRIESGHAHAQDPLSRTRRLITNVQLDEWGQERALVSSNFLLGENRRRPEPAFFVGRYEHDLVRANGSWRIARKKVELLNNDQPITNLTFLV